jgi:small subunit ribosomal protein S16
MNKMIRIRLARRGRIKKPIYSIVAVDQRAKRDGRYLAKLGQYNPHIKDGDVIRDLKAEEIQTWLSNGAQLSDSLKSLFKRYKVNLTAS